MKKYYLILLVILSLLIASCSAMRSPNTTAKSPKNKKERQSKSPKNNSSEQSDNSLNEFESFERFKDTLTVVLPPVLSNAHKSDINSDLDEIVAEFEEGNYESACEKISVYAGIFEVGDSLYYEAKYYEAECFVMNGKAKDAISIYRELLADNKLTISVRERAIIRLGQLYCFTNDKSTAEFMFARLKREFPNSMYIKIANCESINQKK